MPVLEEGQLFERYRINRWLGSGIAGESYEAEDRILQRKVTLRLIHPWGTLLDSARRQFFREMQGISMLNHPYLATVLDYGEIDGRVYVVRRYVSSGSLLSTQGRIWFRPPLEVADAFKYVHQLAQALQYIHQHGYLHGALTFANVLVLRGPNAEGATDYAPFLLADIGLTNFVRRFGNPRVGTLPVSAAPEQLGKKVTPASDQFALAVLLYFWLAGRPPYLGAPDEVEQLKVSETIPPLSRLNPSISLEQDSIILRALAAYPEERHPTVLAFSEALMSSLTSMKQPLPGPARIFTFPPETPREPLSISPDLFAGTGLAGITAAGEKTVQPDLSLPGEELSVRATPVPLDPEPSHTPLEQLLAASHTAPPVESSDLSVEPQPELLSGIPETPYPGEIVSLEGSMYSPPGESEAPQASHQDSLSGVETVAELPAQVDEFALETSASQLASPNPAPFDDVSESVGEATRDVSSPVEAVSIPEGDPQRAVEPEVSSLSGDLSAVPVLQFEQDSATEAVASPHVPEAEELAGEIYHPAEGSVTLPRLIVSSPYVGSPYEFLLTSEDTNVGRAGVSDLLLEQDNLTSRHHALLKRVGEHVLIFDKRSYNGVFINGQKIEAGRGYELADGDHIGIGNYELIFRSASTNQISQLI